MSDLRPSVADAARLRTSLPEADRLVGEFERHKAAGWAQNFRHEFGDFVDHLSGYKEQVHHLLDGQQPSWRDPEHVPVGKLLTSTEWTNELLRRFEMLEKEAADWRRLVR